MSDTASTSEQLKDMLDYNPETGALVWRVPRGPHGEIGKKAGSLSKNGRLYLSVGLARYMAHRVAWCIYYGKWPEQNVSALNGDYTDLRIANYVELSSGLTAQKGGPKRTGQSGIRGVGWDKSRGKWIASITRNYKLINLGRFDSKEEARAAYERAAADMGLFVMDESERHKHYAHISRRTKMRVLWSKTLKAAKGVTDWKSFDDFNKQFEPVDDRHTIIVPEDPNRPVGPANWKWERRQIIDWKDREQRLARNRWHRQAFRTSYRDKELRRSFGITLEDYKRMLLEQNGVCAICLRPETSVRWGKLQPLAVDHCHTTGKVRALLCNNCNVGIGTFGDDPERLMRAAAYLQCHAPKESGNNVVPFKNRDR